MIKKTFVNTGNAFSALYAAEAWCEKKGISVGSTSSGDPSGLMWGDYRIAKWWNCSNEERASFHGKLVAKNMDKGFRDGPVVLEICEDTPEIKAVVKGQKDRKQAAEAKKAREAASEDLYNALQVIANTPKITAFLKKTDPKALEQLMAALVKATPDF